MRSSVLAFFKHLPALSFPRLAPRGVGVSLMGKGGGGGGGGRTRGSNHL